MERLKAAPRDRKPAPGLLTDPPSRTNRQSTSLNSTPQHSSVNLPTQTWASNSRITIEDPGTVRAGSQSDLFQNGSYSARARESLGTAAATRMGMTLANAAQSSEVDVDVASPSTQSPREKRKQDKKAKRAARTPRLQKPPPSASRTPQLFARHSVPVPSTAPGYDVQSHQRSNSYGDPSSIIDSGTRQSRRRSDSMNSITSVSSIASKIKASFELPRGRSTTPRGERSSSFMGGIKLQKEREAEAEWANRQVGPNGESYNIPARYMYRQPGGSSVGRSHSRSSTCSAASISSMAPHIIANPQALTFPPQHRHRGPPTALRKPAPISRSRSSSRSPIVRPEVSTDADLQPPASREGLGDPYSSQNGSRAALDSLPSASRPWTGEGPNRSRPQTSESLRNQGLSDVAALSAVLNSVDLSDSGPRRNEGAPVPSEKDVVLPSPKRLKNPMLEGNKETRHIKPEKQNPSSSSAPAHPATATDPERPQHRRRGSSFLGMKRTNLLSPMKPRNQRTEQPEPAPPEPNQDAKPLQAERPRRASAIRQFRDAAKAAFHIRSPSAVRGRRNSLVSGQVSPAGTAIGSGRTSPFPDIAAITTPPAIPTPEATDTAAPWSRKETVPEIRDTAETRGRPPLTHQNNAVRPSDHSSISSYDTAHSQYLSTVTPDTSRPQSERGLVSTADADDGQKVLPDDDDDDGKSGLPSGTRPTLGGVRNVSTPPPGPKNARRAFRMSGGTETLVAPVTSQPKTEPNTWPLKVEPPAKAEIDAEWVHVTAPFKKKSGRQLLDVSLIPPPLVLHNQTGSIDSNISNPDTLTRGSGASSPQIRPKRRDKVYNDDGVSLNTDSKTSVVSRETKTPPPLASYLGHVRRVGGSATPKGSPRPSGASPLSNPPRGRTLVSEAHVGETLSKVLVQCCSCRYFHDMPTRVYERMKLHGDTRSSTPTIPAYTPKAPEKLGSTAVRCPWCRHEMGIKCCSGFLTSVHLKEKLH